MAEILRVTQQELPPDGATHWSSRSLAEHLGVGKDTVVRTWRDHELKPGSTASRSRTIHGSPKSWSTWSAVPGSARTGGGAQLRREDSDSSLGSHSALALPWFPVVAAR